MYAWLCTPAEVSGDPSTLPDMFSCLYRGLVGSSTTVTFPQTSTRATCLLFLLPDPTSTTSFFGILCTMDRVHIHFKTHICRRLVPTYLPYRRDSLITSLLTRTFRHTTTTQEGASYDYDRSTHAPRTNFLLTLHLPPPSREDAVMVYACTHSCGTAPIL